MEFRKPDGTKRSVYVPRRSLMVFTGEARFLWTHGIAQRRTDLVRDSVVGRTRRVSLTLRHIRRSRTCECAFAALCDSRGYDASSSAFRAAAAASATSAAAAAAPSESKSIADGEVDAFKRPPPPLQ